MRTRNGQCLAWWVVPAALGLLVQSARGAEPAIAVDARVVLKSRDVPLKAGNDVVATPDFFEVYRVERVDRDWLWVVADGTRGWVRASQVVPLDQAVDYFTSAIHERPGEAWPYLMRGLIYAHRGEFQQADADASEAIQRDSRNPIAYHNRGNARLARGDYDGAIEDYNRATDLAPKDAASYANRGVAWAAKHDYDLAIADDNQAIRLDPGDPRKFVQRGSAWAQQQEWERALSDYADALKLNPNEALADNGRAWIWATAPTATVRDGRKALEAAVRANELSGGKNPYILGTLAAASAESGDFAAAVRWQTKALEQFAGDHVDLSAHRRRLELYQEGKPFRTERQN